MFDTSVKINNAAKISAVSGASGIAAALKAGRLYGKYMILDCSDGRRTVKAQMTDCNFDPNAETFAERTATVDSGSFTVYAAALSADGETEDVRAEFENGFEKQAGIPLVVSITVSLKTDGDCAVLTGGENPLVMWLLGESKLYKPRIAFGQNISPLYTAPSVSASYSDATEADVEITENGVMFRAATGEKVGDAVLLIGGTAALRALPSAYAPRVLTKSLTVPIDGALKLGSDVIAVTGVTLGGSPLMSYELSYVPTDCKPPADTGLRVAEGSYLKSDLTKYVAAAGGGEASVLKMKDGKPRLIARRRIYGADSMTRITCDGCLFCVENNKLIRIDTDGNITMTLLPFAPSDYEIICRQSGDYMAAAIYLNRIYVLETDGKGKYGLAAEFTGGTAAFVGRLDARRLILGGKGCGAEVFGDGNSATAMSAKEAAKTLLTASPKKMYASGRTMCKVSTNLNTRVVDAYTQTGYDVGSGGWLEGEQAFVSENTLFSINRSGSLFSMVMDDADELSGVCRLDEGILRLKYDGTLDFMPFYGGSAVLTSDSFSYRSSVVVEYLAPQAQTGETLVTVGLNYG